MSPGSVSEKLASVTSCGPGLLIVKVTVEVPPGVIVFGENVLVMAALTMFTVHAKEEKSLS